MNAFGVIRLTDLSTHLLRATLLPLEKNLACGICKEALHNRISEAMTGWAAIKVRPLLPYESDNGH